MSHFSRQITAQGPLLNVQISVSIERQAILHARDNPVPNPVIVQGLVDTGASVTSIDAAIPQQLGLIRRGTVPILTPSTGPDPVETDTYDVSLTIAAGANEAAYRIPNLSVCAQELAFQGFQVLIGRDVLSRCLLVYNGTMGLYTLAF